MDDKKEHFDRMEEPEPSTEHPFFIDRPESNAPILDADTARNVENIQESSVFFAKRNDRQKRDDEGKQ